jgi:hypothetical protein
LIALGIISLAVRQLFMLTAFSAANETSNKNTITNGDNASSNDSNAQSGAVYVYKRTGTSWAQEAYIKAVNNATYARFGTSVSISDDTIAVGAPGERSNLATINNGATIGSFNRVVLQESGKIMEVL